jgi:phosphonatase-like hydrolase
LQPHDRQAKEIHREFMEELKYAYQTFPIKAQPGAEQLFETLKRQGVLVVLNTGFNAETAYYILKKLGWAIGREIDGVITATDVKNNRPQPDMILKAMEQFGIDNPKAVIKVGDSVVDIQEGQNAGCLLSIGITTGAQTREEMQKSNPDHIVDGLLEILPIITKYNAIAAASY